MLLYLRQKIYEKITRIGWNKSGLARVVIEAFADVKVSREEMADLLLESILSQGTRKSVENWWRYRKTSRFFTGQTRELVIVRGLY